MDIIIPHSALEMFLDTNAKPAEIARSLSLCGPTIDKLEPAGKDWLYHIEIITNRVDSASAFGIAREASAILPQFNHLAKLKNNPYTESYAPKIPSGAKPPVTVKISPASLAPRFTCIALTDVVVKDSPQSVQSMLTASGQRPLNNLIDITNELTLLYGQPVHVFDLDLIKDRVMIVRESRSGEQVTTLDNRTHTLKGGDIVIEDGQGRLIDLCGIMGGALSAVSAKTKNVLLFVQNYDPKKIRTTSLYTQERTLAAQLFEKQTDPELVMPVLHQGVKRLIDRAGARISSQILDIYPKTRLSHKVSLDLNWLSRYAGVNIKPQTAQSILKDLGFIVKPSANNLICTTPSWRLHDITIKEDLVEEVMRIYGYFRLPSLLPPTSLPSQSTDPLLNYESQSRWLLSDLGCTEVYNISLVSSELYSQVGLSLSGSYKLANPLSQDYVYMRPSLTPSLLQNLQHNQGTVPLPFRLFELAHTYAKPKAGNKPIETPTLALATYALSYAQTKGLLDTYFSHLKLKVEYHSAKSTPPYFDQSRTALLTAHKKTLGYLGVLNPKVAQTLTLKDIVVTAELDFSELSNLIDPIHHFHPVPVTPPIIEDLTFTFPPQTAIGPILNAIPQIDATIAAVTLKSTFANNATVTLTYQSKDVLTDQKVAPIRKKVVNQVSQQFSGKLVGTLS